MKVSCGRGTGRETSLSYLISIAIAVPYSLAELLLVVVLTPFIAFFAIFKLLVDLFILTSDVIIWKRKN